MMDVAFYHDDGLVNYEQQSSPSSVGSAGSTDIGVVPAICPPYSSANFNKETVLKGLNLDLSPREQLKLQHLKANENTVNVISSTGALRMNNTGRLNGNTHHRVSNGGTISEQAVHHNGVITSAYGPLVTASTLASPDVNMLKLGSPDLERLISDNQHHNGHYLPQKQQLAPGVTEEQEMYAQGFERELERIKSRSGSNPDIQASQPASSVVSESSQCSVITTGVNQLLARQHQPFLAEQYYHQQAVNATPGMAGNQPVGSTIHHMNPVISHLKEEPPQTVPVLSHTPPMSPIDLVSQEMMKSERKRQRNRVAASKCRKRKLERISRLEDKVKSLKTQNMELSTNANILRQQVADLKSKVMAHVNSGCQLMMSQQQATF